MNEGQEARKGAGEGLEGRVAPDSGLQSRKSDSSRSSRKLRLRLCCGPAADVSSACRADPEDLSVSG